MPIYVHDILKRNEATSMQIGTSGARDKGMKQSTLGKYKVKITEAEVRFGGLAEGVVGFLVLRRC